MRFFYNMADNPGALVLMGALGATLLGPTISTVARPIIKGAATSLFTVAHRAQGTASRVSDEWNSIVGEARQGSTATEQQVAALGHS